VFIETIGKKSLKNVRKNSKRSCAVNSGKNCVVHSFLLPSLSYGLLGRVIIGNEMGGLGKSEIQKSTASEYDA
jgi:hypothetical protein